jgi:UDP-N-acetylmuramoyl-tripeptide--D-alanyl-D-alanine ligase
MKHFRTLDNVAAEKAELPARLRRGGIAIMNGDDPRVAAMADSLQRRVVWFGSSAAFDYRGSAAAARWPRRFSFEIQAGSERATVQTRLVGTHWMPSVLGAIAAAHVCGVPLDNAIEAVGAVDPVPARMQPAPLPSGAVVIRDELDNSIDSVVPALKALADAEAPRKILILADVMESSKSPRDRLRVLGKEIARIFDTAVFIGDRAGHGVRGAVAGGMSPEQAHQFYNWEQAVEFLREELKPGDLALLRGGRISEHFSRIYFALAGTISCRKAHCEKRIVCDLCPELGAVTALPAATAPSTGTDPRLCPGPRARA